MSDLNSNTPNDKKIEPAPWAQSPVMTAPEKHWWQDPKTLIPLVLLVVLLVLVVFWLPTLVSPPSQQKEEAVVTNSSESAAATAASGKSLESPWSEAQLAKQRREAQDILAKILDQQRALEAASVNRWEADGFAEAMATAAEGDNFYRDREFEQAKTNYNTSLQQFEALVAKKDLVFEEKRKAGLDALEQHDPVASVENLDLALAIKPNDKDVEAALERANNLEQVLDLIKVSKQLQQQNEWEFALEKLNEAKTLDSQSSLVKDELNSLSLVLLDRDFAEKMSDGYTALDSNRYSSAITAFKAALKLKPNAADAKSALLQAQNNQTQSTLNRHLVSAQQSASGENWQDAIGAYDKALALDANLIDAKIGKIKAQARLKLDESMQALLSDPLRLSDNNVSQQARTVLADANAIPDAGPKLSGQISQLTQALAVAQTPITVRFQSDNETQVTLYRIGQLGNFEQHSMALKPGKYTVVGSRPGYRDVRKVFTVSPSNQSPIVRIQCEEKIASL
ncbi:hypothetical protein [Sessilibacter corallicola]|uniref:hypothetical protein n=1 Tax=Sessilibacter corallicola TaxID=2904075 RepID=UPI001E47B40C|nr:hypothetical protein [Sessilibacter corallicola]MCE2028616.1 hypothetical protein [Sessilibacter corallicola]